MTQASFNEDAIKVVSAETVIIATIAGIAFKSWWIFGIVFLGIIIAFNIPKIALYLSMVLSLGWGYVGWYIGSNIIENVGASVVLAIIATLGGFGYHLGAIEYTEDLNSYDG